MLGPLLREGGAVTDPHGLGLVVNAAGQVMGREGPTPGLYVMGSLRRGECWESNAVPELRVQAAALAELLTAS